MVLIFSPAIFQCRHYYSYFFWIISLSSLHWGSLLSFHFIPPPVLGSSLLYPSPGETQPILSTLFHSLLTSEPLSPSSPPVSALCIFLLFCFTCWRRCQVGVARVGGLAGSTSYPICVSIMSCCPCNPPLIHQPASQGAQAASSRRAHTHTHSTD